MKVPLWLALLCACGTACSQTLSLPPRPPGAPSGSALLERLTPLSTEERERQILAQVAAGNVPDFLRRLCPVSWTNADVGRPRVVTFWAAPDYLAVGSDEDHILMPLTAAAAQRVADLAGCCLPTPRMVDAIYAATRVRLPPVPLPPGPAMTTLQVFAQHNGIVRTQRQAALPAAPLGALVAGHKKDVVVSARLAAVTNRVAIYGWHRTNGTPIQPLYVGHGARHVDYSHGVRLVHQDVLVDGQKRRMADVLADPATAALLSHEGPVWPARYPTNQPPGRPPPRADAASPRAGRVWGATELGPGGPYLRQRGDGKFHGGHRRECVVLAEVSGRYATRAAARADFFRYAEAYDNRGRLHSALGTNRLWTLRTN